MSCLRLHHLYRLLISAVFLSVPIGTIAAGEPSGNYEPVRQSGHLETVIPYELKKLHLPNPRVKFNVLVDAEGKITDFLAVEATHVDLLEKAIAKLDDAKFKPATKDGEAVPGRISIFVNFFDPEQRAWRQGNQGVPAGGSVTDAVDRRIYSMKADELRYQGSSPNQLDEPLKILESKLYLIHPPDEPAPTGKVIVEYAIDHEGRVRLPEILSSDSENLSLSVLMTLQETRFGPPTKSGHPTYVKVRQPFNFD